MELRLDSESQRVVREALNHHWSHLGKVRVGMKPPDDQPIIAQQRRIERVVSAMRDGHDECTCELYGSGCRTCGHLYQEAR